MTIQSDDISFIYPTTALGIRCRIIIDITYVLWKLFFWFLVYVAMDFLMVCRILIMTFACGGIN